MLKYALLLTSALFISGCGKEVVKEVSNSCEFKLIGYDKPHKYGTAKFLVNGKIVSLKMGKHQVPNEKYGNVFTGVCGQKTYEDGSLKNTYAVSFRTKMKPGSSKYMLPNY